MASGLASGPQFTQRTGMWSWFYDLPVWEQVGLFLLTGKLVGMSAFNPFGLLSYQLISGTPIFQGPWHMLLVTHVFFPVVLSILAFYLVREMYGQGQKRKAKAKTKSKSSGPSLKKTDI